MFYWNICGMVQETHSGTKMQEKSSDITAFEHAHS